MSVRRHALFNLLGALIPTAVALVTIPLYLHRIGDARYGVLAIVWLLLGYFGLFDLGLGRATAQRIAAQAGGTPAERADSLWTALLANLALGLLGGLLLWPLAAFGFGRFLSLGPGLLAELQSALPWLVLALPVATVSGVLSGALEGRMLFFELNLISVGGAVVTQCLPLAVALLLGADLGTLIPAVVLSRAFSVAALAWRCHRALLQDQRPRLSLPQLRALLAFGGWVTVSSLVGPLMVALDRFVIGATLGAQAVTWYTVPFQLGERASVVPNALASAVFPRLAGQTAEQGQQLAGIATRTLAAVVTPMMLLAILVLQPFLALWVNPQLAAHSAVPGAILLAGFWINSLARLPYAQLQASGHPDRVAKSHVIELLPYLLLLFLGLRYAGLPGAALAFALRAAADWTLLAWWAGALRQQAPTLAGACVLVLFALAVVLAAPADHLAPQRLLPAAVVFGLGLAWSWWVAPREVRAMLLRREAA